MVRSMQIPPQPLTVNLTGPLAQATAWKPGQVLEAVVTRSQAGSTRTEIRIGNARLTLELPAPVPQGSRLALQVVRAGAQPTLALLSAASGTAHTPIASQASLTTSSAPATPAPAAPPLLSPAWLASLLPAQGSQAPLLSALSWLVAQPERLQSLPQPVRAALEQVTAQIPGVEQATRAEGLKQAVARSGLFHEASLAIQATATVGASTVPAPNLKSVLLSLAARLRAHAAIPRATPAVARPMDIPPPRPGAGPTPQARTESGLTGLTRDALLEVLRTRTESALARLALHQWSALENPDTGLPRWLLELPLRSQQGVDLVHLLLEREAKRDEPDEGPTWRAELALDLPGLGPVHVHVAVTGEHVQTRFWAEDPDTVRRIRTALPVLRDKLEERALRVRDLGCHEGHPPPRNARAPSRTPLLDDRA
jgi:hypothetical protein